MTKSLIIFDMDGTLIDSSRLLAHAVNCVRSRLHLPPMPPEQIIGQINNHQINPARYFYGSDHFEPIHEQWFSEYYTAHHDQELLVYHGVPALLIWLKEQGCRIALATNAHRASTLESLRHLGIEPFFDAVVCHDDVEHPKPAPDMLYRILEQLNCPRESALFVGDGPRDEEAAEAAEMDYIMVDWGFTEHPQGKKVIHNVRELKEALEKAIKMRG
jgi:phosphoglycolate phosphatase